MAALPATPSGVLRFDFRFTVGANLNVNTSLRFAYTGGPPTQAQMATMATSARTAFGTNMASLLWASYSLNEVWVRDLANPATPVGVDATAVPGTSVASKALPASACVVIGYKLARSYRGGHPRGYWPLGTDNNLTVPGSWDSNFITGVNTGINALIAAIVAAGAGCTITHQVNVSYYAGETQYTRSNGKIGYRATPRGTPQIDQITSVQANAKVGSQRRRLKHA